MVAFASARISSNSASIDHTISTTISPNRAVLEEFDDDVQDDEGKPSITDCKNVRKPSAVKECLCDHVLNIEHRSTWYAVVSTSAQLGSEGLQCGEMSMLRLCIAIILIVR
jgi:hypothetical protein